jgi:ATP-dependent RNA helicase DeaD
MNSSFSALHIEEGYVSKLEEMGILTPSPIQQEAIPIALAGKDVVAQSQTGSGKTLAYALPLLQKIDKSSKEAQAIVIVPTRELGFQIVQTLDLLAEDSGIRVQGLIGGAALSRQIDKLKLRPQVIVGTPGRVMELLKLRKLSLHYVTIAVVDEVDQVFDLGSMQEVEAIFKGMQRNRQMLFFSATMPEPIQAVISRWMQEPVYVQISSEQKTSETLQHFYFVCEDRDKIDTLRRLVRLYNMPAAIVFVNEIDNMAEVVEKLKFAGLSIEALYSEAGKQERAKVMQSFRAGKFQLLLATDIAARGLDIPHVTHVINFEPPIDADHYVHRVGRTGRMGKKGTAISIITNKQRFIIEKFGKVLGCTMQEKEMAYGKVYQSGPRGVGKGAESYRGEGTSPSLSNPQAPAVQTSASGAKPFSGKGTGKGKSPAASVISSAVAYNKPAGVSSKPGSKPVGSSSKYNNNSEGGSSQSNSKAESGSSQTNSKAGVDSIQRKSRPAVEGSVSRGRSPVATSNASKAKPGIKQGGKPVSQKTERELNKERKNKGAPRWLKEKQNKPT